jgi:hypothetical protein
VTRAARAAAAADEPVGHVVTLLRERLYGAISCLATLAVLARYTTEDTSAWARILDLAVATGGLWAASLFADWVAHLAVRRTELPWWQQALAVAGLVGVGVLVLGIKILAH